MKILASVEIASDPKSVWDEVMNVDLQSYQVPSYFKWLNLPNPINASFDGNTKNGVRMAYFKGGHTFTQTLTNYEFPKRMCFQFEASRKFVAGYMFNLNNGPFRIEKGEYRLEEKNGITNLSLETEFYIAKAIKPVCSKPFQALVSNFQRYLLTGIKNNLELGITPKQAENKPVQVRA